MPNYSKFFPRFADVGKRVTVASSEIQKLKEKQPIHEDVCFLHLEDEERGGYEGGGESVVRIMALVKMGPDFLEILAFVKIGGYYDSNNGTAFDDEAEVIHPSFDIVISRTFGEKSKETTFSKLYEKGLSAEDIAALSKFGVVDSNGKFA
jgi:hypothetical protein